MLLEALEIASIQAVPAILLIWAGTRLFPSISPKIQVWLWRIVFLRLTLGLFLWPAVNLPVLPAEPVYVASESVTTTYVAPPPAPFPWLEVAWIGGVLLLAILATRESVRARRLVLNATQAPRTPTPDAQVASRIPWRISDDAQVPMVVGILRPVILIPRDVAETADADELRMVVAHEEGHVVHRDLIWAWLIWAGRAAFFFHPLVWLAARCERFAREAAADRYALDSAKADPHRYGQVLMRVALAGPHARSLSPAGLAMSDSYRFVYRRLETMKHHSRRLTLGRILSTGALCALTLGLLPAFNFVPAEAQPPMDDLSDPASFIALEPIQQTISKPAQTMGSRPAAARQTSRSKARNATRATTSRPQRGRATATPARRVTGTALPQISAPLAPAALAAPAAIPPGSPVPVPAIAPSALPGVMPLSAPQGVPPVPGAPVAAPAGLPPAGLPPVAPAAAVPVPQRGMPGLLPPTAVPAYGVPGMPGRIAPARTATPAGMPPLPPVPGTRSSAAVIAPRATQTRVRGRLMGTSPAVVQGRSAALQIAPPAMADPAGPARLSVADPLAPPARLLSVRGRLAPAAALAPPARVLSVHGRFDPLAPPRAESSRRTGVRLSDPLSPRPVQDRKGKDKGQATVKKSVSLTTNTTQTLRLVNTVSVPQTLHVSNLKPTLLMVTPTVVTTQCKPLRVVNLVHLQPVKTLGLASPSETLSFSFLSAMEDEDEANVHS